MAEFTMPSLGADMEEGTLVEWLVGPGDTVTKGDVVAVVETAKSTIEVECFDSGTISALLVEPGTTVPVGTPMASIDSAVAPPARPAAKQPITPAPAPPPDLQPAPSRPVTRTERAVSTPLVRHLAEEKGIDLSTVHGSGKEGGSPATTSNTHRPSRRTGCGHRRSRAAWLSRWASIWGAYGAQGATAPSGRTTYVLRRWIICLVRRNRRSRWRNRCSHRRPSPLRARVRRSQR